MCVVWQFARLLGKGFLFDRKRVVLYSGSKRVLLIAIPILLFFQISYAFVCLCPDRTKSKSCCGHKSAAAPDRVSGHSCKGRVKPVSQSRQGACPHLLRSKIDLHTVSAKVLSVSQTGPLDFIMLQTVRLADLPVRLFFQLGEKLLPGCSALLAIDLLPRPPPALI